MDNVFPLEVLIVELGQPAQSDAGLSWPCGCIAEAQSETNLYRLKPCDNDDGRLVGA
jgi:hypothetical protein